MATTLTLKRHSQDWKVERYEAEISISEADRDRVTNDLPGLMRDLLEKQGHQVRRVLLPTEFAKRAQAATMSGEARGLMCEWAHIVYPDSERSIWILV
jgi:hypothetical protein